MKERIISATELAALAHENTNAHRLWTGPRGWVERFGEDYLVSTEDEAEAIVERMNEWLPALGLRAGRIFVRRLVKQPGQEDKPEQVFGEKTSLATVAQERGLKFGIDFSAGYAAGMFCDQRANREHLESLRPRKVLNCFAYTCAFSVAAARVDASSTNLDLSRKSLDRGQANFVLNDFDLAGHRFLADDVFAVLPRLARRGEKFDAIILDPPTFSRGAKGRIFRAERDLGKLLEQALDVAEAGARILLSTNAREIDADALENYARGLKSYCVPAPAEYPSGSAATTLWLVAP